MFIKITFLVIFIIITIGVGIYSRTRVHGVNDFLLGNRSVGPWISAFAYGTTYFSAVVFVGYAGKFGWANGLSVVWIGIGNAVIGCLLAWILMGKRTRTMTHKLNASTMPEFFAARYDSIAMKIVSALVIFIFLVPYTASIYKGLGFMLESSFGIPMNTIILIMTVLTGIYLILGGYVATALNDFIQGIVMIAGVILMVVFVLSRPEIGGLANGLQALSTMGDKTVSGSQLVSVFGPGPWKLGALVLMTSLGTWGLLQMVHKFYAIKDEKAIKRGTVISSVFAFIIGGGAYFTGVFSRVILNNTVPKDSTGAVNMGMIIPVMLNALPVALTGVIIVLMLSASMSTLSSLVLVSSSVISIDLIKGFIKPDIDQKRSMFNMRIFCLVFVVLSFVMAIWSNPAIDALMSVSWGVISGMFIAPYLYGLLWKGTTRLGAWAGFASGFITMTIGMIIELGKPGVTMANAFIPGIASIAMLVSLAVVPVVSLATKKFEAAHIQKVFESADENVA